jgi:uncharacterized membrane protein
MAPKSERWWLTTDHVDVVIDAPAERIYDMVADLTRMGEWSNECAQVEWVDGATGPAAGARFVGHNRTGPRGVIKWSRRGRVLVAERGREFAFATEEGGQEGVVWRYRFEPLDDGTRVSESYEVTRIPTWARIVDVPTNRHGALLKSMRHTLARLKTSAETLTHEGDRS